MPYITKEEAAACRKAINKIAKKYGFRVSVRNRDSMVLEIALTAGRAINEDDLPLSGLIGGLYYKAKAAGVSTYQGVEEFLHNEGIYNIKMHNDIYYIFKALNGKSFEVNQYSINNYFVENSDFYKFFNESLTEAKKLLNWYDNSDSMIDYFDTKAYFELSVGRWDKDYMRQ